MEHYKNKRIVKKLTLQKNIIFLDTSTAECSTAAKSTNSDFMRTRRKEEEEKRRKVKFQPCS